MQRKIILVFFILAAIFILSCDDNLSNPVPTSAPVTNVPTPPPQIIDHMGVQTGTSIPEWLDRTIEELESEVTYQLYYFFIEDHPQLIDTDNVENSFNTMLEWATNYVFQENIRNLVASRVNKKFESLAGNNNIILQTYKEKFLQFISEAAYAEAQLVDHFWIRKRYYNMDNTINYDEFRYFYLITDQREELNTIVQNAFNTTNDLPWAANVITAATSVQQQWGNTL